MRSAFGPPNAVTAGTVVGGRYGPHAARPRTDDRENGNDRTNSAVHPLIILCRRQSQQVRCIEQVALVGIEQTGYR
jgi:hypothetical protein